MLVHSHSNSKEVRKATLQEPHYVIKSLQRRPPPMLFFLYSPTCHSSYQEIEPASPLPWTWTGSKSYLDQWDAVNMTINSWSSLQNAWQLLLTLLGRDCSARSSPILTRPPGRGPVGHVERDGDMPGQLSEVLVIPADILAMSEWRSNLYATSDPVDITWHKGTVQPDCRSRRINKHLVVVSHYVLRMFVTQQ